jgi:hypothetical protein
MGEGPFGSAYPQCARVCLWKASQGASKVPDVPFVAALPDAVVGRDISDLTVDRLAGSSGCSEGFMDALAQIKERAAA